MATKKAPKFPKTVGTCADRLYTLQQQRLALKKQMDKIAEQEAELGEHTLGLLNTQKLDSGKGKIGRVSKVPKEVPTVSDWGKFYAWIKKTGAFDTLQKRPAVEAIRDRWADKVRIPGVTKTAIMKLSIGKAA
jgi:hypothetical protein